MLHELTDREVGLLYLLFPHLSGLDLDAYSPSPGGDGADVVLDPPDGALRLGDDTGEAVVSQTKTTREFPDPTVAPCLASREAT